MSYTCDIQSVNNIKYAILGPVSAGKSTFFNALFTQTCSDMKRKKTTMLPQIYQVTHSKNVDTVETIYEKNKKSNETILLKRENNTFDFNKDFVEINHNVSKLTDFVTLPDKNATYSILDMPGLNCGGDEMYYEYIKNISSTIDIYFVLFDINSGLNTSDEIKIVDLVVNEVKKNKHGYVYFLINKCDELEFDENGNVIFNDEELNELYFRSVETINSKCADIKEKIYITPICSSKLYIYRGVKNDIMLIDEKQLDSIIKTTCGTRELKKINSLQKKRDFIKGLLEENKQKKSESTLYESWMEETGYHVFKQSLEMYIQKSYSEIICHHVEMEINKAINIFSKISDDYDFLYKKMTNEMMVFDNLITNVMKTTKQNKIPLSLIEKIKQFNTLICDTCQIVSNTVITYNKNEMGIINNLLETINKYCSHLKKYIGDCVKTYNFVNEKKQKIMTNSFLIEFNSDIYKELKSHLTNDQLKQSMTSTLQIDNNVTHFIRFYNIYEVVSTNQTHLDILLNVFNLMLNSINDIYFNENIKAYMTHSFVKNIQQLDINDKYEIFDRILKILKLHTNEKNLLLNNVQKIYRMMFIDTIQHNASIFLEWKQSNVQTFNDELKYIYYKVENDIKNTNHNQCVKIDFENFTNRIKFFDLIYKSIVNYLCEKNETFLKNLQISENEISCDESSHNDNSDNESCYNDNSDDDQSENSINSKNVFTKAMKNAAKTSNNLLQLGKKLK